MRWKELNLNTDFDRRQFLIKTAGIATAGIATPISLSAAPKPARTSGVKLKLSLNAYSFNKPLRAGDITLPEVIDYCANLGFDGLDATGYYFPGYPDAPSDDYIYDLKKHAFLNGITINGTGVRNDFAVADPASRKKDVQMVKDWIEVAAKLGATVIRIFSGKKTPEGHSFEDVLEWMIPDIQECVAFGEKHGVIVGLQNHNDFVKTADEMIKIIESIDSAWFGLILDVGSLRKHDPYVEIEKLLPYAVSWQLKENVWFGDKETPTDLHRVKAIIDRSGYRGFFPIETLGAGDPRIKVKRYYNEVKRVFV